MNHANYATSAADAGDLAALCASHFRHEEALLSAALPIVRAVYAAFSERGFAAVPAALGGHQDFAGLIEEMNRRRQCFRDELARRLGIMAADVSLARVLNRLPASLQATVADSAARARRLAEELAATNFRVSVHLRVHLDAYRRILRDLTNSTTSSGRYGPAGKTESHEYRPLIQIHG
jgi:hypothetical protein